MSEKSYRTAQLSTLAAFLPWGSSKGAGRMTLTPVKGNAIIFIRSPPDPGYRPDASSIRDVEAFQPVKQWAPAGSGG